MTLLDRYTWLIETVRLAGEISFQEISKRWARVDKNGKKLHRATFCRWREGIEDEFGIRIKCRKTDVYLYYIDNSEDMMSDGLKNWMLDSLATASLISDSLTIKDRILVGDIPSGREHLTTIINAMKEGREIELTFRPFNSRESYEFPVRPYCVKLFDGRWYLLAYNINYGDMRIYGLDRIVRATITDKTFKLPGKFNAHEYFESFYGIVVDESLKPQRIVLRANKSHRNYLKSLPMHPSQEVAEEFEDYTDFSLYLAPTYDFIMKLLQSGPFVEVLKPASLREEMKNWIERMSEIYRKD